MPTAPAIEKAQAQVCDLCGSDAYQVFATRGRWGSKLTTVICRDCGLVYSNPRPSEEENAEFYKRNYWGIYKGQTEPGEAFFNRRIPKIKSMLSRLKPFLRPGVSVLEIGSGAGALLWSIKQTCNGDGQFVGIEPHQAHARFCREAKGLNVYPGLLEEIAPKFKKRSFDLVVMNHVLEHTISPTRVFETVKSLLKPDGVFVVEVPNIAAPGSRLSHFFHVAHHYNFSPNTLRRLGLKTGFSVEQVEELDGDLPRTRLFAIFRNTPEPAPRSEVKSLRDDPEQRSRDLHRYNQWYWVTLASLRKKIIHLFRQLS